MTTIHDRIKARRIELELSQTQVGEAVGVSWQSVQQWENGKTTPKRGRVRDLAKVLNTSVDYLERGTRSRYREPGQLQAPNACEPRDGNELISPINMPQKWPFKRISIERVVQLSASDLAYVEGRLAAALEECESALDKRRLNTRT